jgi:hypothetical protein
MRRTALILLLASAGWAFLPGSRAAAPTGGPEPRSSRAFSVDEAFGHVRRLAGRIGPRPAGTAPYRQAVRYVRGEFESLDYDVRLQGFRLPQGGRSWNVVATSGGAPVRLLVGAHLDTVRGSPGGNDNASGVAALLEVARLVGNSAVDGLALVAFGAEEFQPVGGHHLGSAVYVRRMTTEEREALELMVSADMVGKARPFIAAHLEGTPAAGARELARGARSTGSRVSVRALGDISDHGPFALARMPAAFLWTGDEPNHHQPTDLVRNVDRRALRRTGAVLLAVVDRVLGPG